MMISAQHKTAIRALIAFAFCINNAGFAQSTVVTGVVRDARTAAPLQFANVRIEGGAKGTTTDKRGRFTLSLDPGTYAFIASYLGYRSDRQSIAVARRPLEVSFSLEPVNIEHPGVTVTPGENPALRIIRRAIESKQRRKELLRSYSLTSHSKLVVKASEMTGISINSLGDSAFTAVLETQTDAVWAAPDRHKEVIKARKQTSFIPARSNIMISSFFLIDFSADVLPVSDLMTVVGPISDAGLRNYDYTLVGMTERDGRDLYKIEIAPRSDLDPLLQGMIYIADTSYALAMVDVALNDAALPTFFKKAAFKQNFRLFDDRFWMPVDVVVDAQVEVSLIVSVKLAIEGFSVLQEYRINDPEDEKGFDRTRIKVLKEADERDSVYWSVNQKIPNTEEETLAYRKADSVKARMDSLRNDYDPFDIVTGKSFRFDETDLTVPGVLNLYHFNRAQGHALELPLSVRRPFDPVNSAEAAFGYGFSDKRFRYDARIGVRVIDGPRVTVTGRVFDRVTNIDSEHDQWDEFNTTLSNILFKYDYKDYYSARGWRVGASADLFWLFPTNLSVSHERHGSMDKRSDWSIFRRDRPYRDNPPINDGTLTGIDLSLSFDDRDFIDNAGAVRRFGRREHTPRIGFGYHRADLGGEQFTYTTYAASLNGRFDLGRAGMLTYRIAGDMAREKMPTQALYLLPGTVDYISEDWRFRTLGFREFGGDRRVTLSVLLDFGDQLFRWLHIPLLESSEWGLTAFMNAGWTRVSEASRRLQMVVPAEAKTPFVEAGFGINRIFLLFGVDVAWRLNHTGGGRNFFVGISTPITQ